MKCLSINIDSITKQPQFIFIDNANVLHVFTIDFAEEESYIKNYSKSEALDYYLYSNDLKSKLGLSYEWDFWFFSVTKHVTLADQRFEFTNQVGIVFGLSKNRRKKLLKQEKADFQLQTTEFQLTPDLYVSNQYRKYFSRLEIQSLNGLKNVQMTFLDIKQKNEWVNQLQACKPIEIKPVDSICQYFEVFSSSQKDFLDLRNVLKEVPQQTSLCDSNQLFDMSKYSRLTEGEKSIRAVCYPVFNDETSSEIPVSSAQIPMLIVDYENWTIKWNERIPDDSKVLNKFWSLKVNEFSDDNNWIGLDSKAKFTSKNVKNKVINLEPDQDSIFVLVPIEKFNDFHISIKCWSVRCPDGIINYNQQNFTIWSNAIDTNQLNRNGTYIFFIEMDQISIKNSTKFTFSFVLPASKITKPKGINIDAPFSEWYKTNKANLIWYAPPPKQDSEQSKNNQNPKIFAILQSQKALIKTYADDLDEKDIETLQTWSQEDFSLAYKEALERINRKTVKTDVKVNMDQNGILTIDFSSEVFFPSYFMKQFQSQPGKYGPGSLKRRLKIFFKEEDSFVVNPNQGFVEPNEISNVCQQNFENLKQEELCFRCFMSDKEREKYKPEELLCSSCSTLEEKLKHQKQIERFLCNQCSWLIDSIKDEKICNRMRVGLSPYCDEKVEQCAKEQIICENGFEECKYIICNPGDACNELNSCKPYDLQCICDRNPSVQQCTEIRSSVNANISTETVTPNAFASKSTKNNCDDLDTMCLYGCVPEDQECIARFQCSQTTDYNGCMIALFSKGTDCGSDNLHCCPTKNPGCHLQKMDDSSKETATVSKICSESQYFEEKSQKCKELQIYFGFFDNLFKISLIGAENQTEQNFGKRMLYPEFTYSLKSISSKQIKVQLLFENPILVSQQDIIVIEMNFTSFNPGLEITKFRRPCTKQVVQGLATTSLNSISKAAQSATAASVALKFLMRGSMAQIWGFINGMQFAIHLPTLNINLPGNGYKVMKNIALVATFDIPYVNLQSVPKIYKVTDVKILTGYPENIVDQMDSLGYNNAFISTTMGSQYLFLIATLAGLLLIVLTQPFRSRASCCGKTNEWLKKKLLWNWIIRFLLEQVLELGFGLILMFQYGVTNKQYPWTIIDFILGIVLAILLFSLPGFIIFFYSKYHDKLKDEEFKEKFGTAMEGFDPNYESICYSAMFVCKRFAFILVSLYLFKYPLIQLPIILILTILDIAFIYTYSPYLDQLGENLEIMNQISFVILIEVCFLFTNISQDLISQYQWCYLFITVILVCICVQLYFILANLVWQFRLALKKRLYQRKQRARQIIAREQLQDKEQSDFIQKNDLQLEENSIKESKESSQSEQLNENISGKLESIQESSVEDQEASLQPDQSYQDLKESKQVNDSQQDFQERKQTNNQSQAFSKREIDQIIAETKESLCLHKVLVNTPEGLVQITSFENHAGQGWIEIQELVLLQKPQSSQKSNYPQVRILNERPTILSERRRIVTKQH